MQNLWYPYVENNPMNDDVINADDTELQNNVDEEKEVSHMKIKIHKIALTIIL